METKNTPQMEKKELGLVDMMGNKLSEQDILFNQKDYYKIFISKSPISEGKIELISCTQGYIHDVTQETLSEFVRVGSFEDAKCLLECD